MSEGDDDLESEVYKALARTQRTLPIWAVTKPYRDRGLETWSEIYAAMTDQDRIEFDHFRAELEPGDIPGLGPSSDAG